MALLLGLTPGPLSADIPTPPVVNMRALASPGCPQTALNRAVAARRSEVLSCVDKHFASTLPISCRFDDTWRATQCTLTDADKKRVQRDGLKPGELACILRELARLTLRPPAGSPPASGCVANIQIDFTRSRRRPGRPDEGNMNWID